MREKVLGNRSLDRFDTLIIGSGAGGAQVASMLCSHGQRVLVLETGPNYLEGLDDPAMGQPRPLYSNDELKLNRRFSVFPDPLVSPRTFRPSSSGEPRTFVGEVNSLPQVVGGGTLHSSLKTPRLLPDDFRMGTLLGSIPDASFADWPIGYDALEPFYLHVERLMGIQGLAGSHPLDPPRSAPFPLPPSPGMYISEVISRGTKKLGYHLFPLPSAVASQPYDGRPACNHCGFCGGYGCPINAKGAPGVTALRRALLSRNCQLRAETRAVRLLLSDSKREVVGVEAIDPKGERQIFRADRYVLAASAIEDARLLLMSTPGGVGNSSGLVGRNLMFHLETLVLGIFDERLHGHRGRTSTHGFLDFRGVPGDPNRPLGGIVEVSGVEYLINEALTYARILRLPFFQFSGARLKSLMRQSPGRDRSIALGMLAEDAPQPTNRVDLDPEVRDLDGLPVARVSYSSHAFERTAQDFYKPKLLALLGAAGARYAFPVPASEVPATRHIMGTLRFGSDPAKSVCNPQGRFHDVGNLYAADGSLFPTSSGCNPTLTIAALATRVAADMVSPGSPERAL